MTDHEIVTMMERYGGSFVRALAAAWFCADETNRATLKAAFPEYRQRYAEMAEQGGKEMKGGQ